MEAELTRDMVAEAAKVFKDGIKSPGFFPWPLEPVIVFLEEVIEQRKDFDLAARSGLQKALDGCVANAGKGFDSLFLSSRAQIFLNDLRAILDKVDRERDTKFAHNVLNAWVQHFVPA